VFAQYTNDLLFVEAAPFHPSSPFQATNSTSNWLSFRGARQSCCGRDRLVERIAHRTLEFHFGPSVALLVQASRAGRKTLSATSINQWLSA
jgi:hypothetical protein